MRGWYTLHKHIVWDCFSGSTCCRLIVFQDCLLAETSSSCQPFVTAESAACAEEELESLLMRAKSTISNMQNQQNPGLYSSRSRDQECEAFECLLTIRELLTAAQRYVGGVFAVCLPSLLLATSAAATLCFNGLSTAYFLTDKMTALYWKVKLCICRCLNH